MLGTAPVVVFIVEDERQAIRYLRTADRVVTTRIAEAGTPEDEWPCPGRQHIVFAVERDIHMGSFEALALPELPPDLRVRLHGEEAKACQPRRVAIFEPPAANRDD